MSDQHDAQMEQLLAVEAAPIEARARVGRWLRENLFSSVVSGILTVVTVLALIGFLYGILGWVFAPQRALVPLTPVSAEEFVAYYEGDLPEGVELDARTIILLNPDAAVGGGAGSVATFEFVPGEEYVVAETPDGDVTVEAPAVPVAVEDWVLALLLDDLNRTSRVDPDQSVEAGDRLAVSTTTIEFEVPAGVSDVTGFAAYLLSTSEAFGWQPTDELVDGSEDEYAAERVAVDPDKYLTTAADVRRLNDLDEGELLTPGETYRVEGSARQWNAISTNSRNYATLAYPSADYQRVWVSFGIVIALAGLSLAAWSNRPRMSAARLARKLTTYGVLFAAIVLLAPWSFAVDLTFLLSAVVLAVVGFLVRGHLLRRDGEEKEDMPLMGMVLFFVLLFIALLWVLPSLVEKIVIADTTRIPFTIMAGIGIAAYWAGKGLRALLGAAGGLKAVLVGLWGLSMPVIYLVILRAPKLAPEGELWTTLRGGIAIALVLAVIGAIFVWFAANPDSGEPGKVIAGLVLVVALFAWAPYEALIIGTLLAVASLLSVVWFAREPGLVRGLVMGALLLATVLVWFPGFLEVGTYLNDAGREQFLFHNVYLEQIKTKMLLAAMASFVLAAIGFGGNPRARAALVGGWVVAAALTTWFSFVSEGGTGLELQSDFLGGLTLTILLAFGGILLSFPIGVLLALGRTSTMPLFRLMSTAYIETVRGVPLITVLFFGALFLPLFLPADLRIADALKALIAITGFSAAYLAENVRGGLQSIPTGQYEASQALGMSTVQMTIFITLPQALRAVIPALVGQVIALFKDTSLVAIVGLADLLLVARAIVPGQPAFIGSQLENLAFVAVVYWIFTFSFSRASLRIERKLGLGER